VDKLIKRLAAGEVLPPPKKLDLLPGDKVKYGGRTYKVEKKLHIEPREVPHYCKEDELAFIDKLSHAECKVVHDRVQARLSQMRTGDLLVYGIKRTYRDEVRYYTCVDGKGWGQLLATDLEHTRLWLTSRRATADSLCKALAGNWPRSSTYEVIEILKTDAINLPCYTTGCNYSEYKEMVE
jgi:hypothetical protein